METIDFVFQLLPFLIPAPANPNDVILVEGYIMQSRIELQCDLGKTDEQVFVESEYNNQEKMIVALYTSCNLLVGEAIENVGGSQGGAPKQNKILSKAKADVTEAQWTIPKAADGNAIILGVPGMCASFKKRMCSTAKSCGIKLTICIDPKADKITADTQFWDSTCDTPLGGCTDGGSSCGC